jgi:anti-sigma regulatory factor (Ser/Thr protein kinase)
VRKLMDEVEYERRDGRNRLRLARRLVPMEA